MSAAPAVIHLSPNWRPASMEFRCPYSGCAFRREFGTLKGIRNGLVKHLLRAHDIQVLFDFNGTSLSEIRDRSRRTA